MVYISEEIIEMDIHSDVNDKKINNKIKTVNNALLTSFGILSIKYRASELELYFGDIQVPDEVKNKKISLREATKLFNNHPAKKVDLTIVHCKCQGKCYEDRRCVCFKNNKDCTSHCENHLTGKKCKCLNMGKHK